MQQTTLRLVVVASVISFGIALTIDTGTAHADSVLYDLDFGSPPHTVGQLPVIGGGAAPRNTVSSIPFGTPTVVASVGPLTDQPLSLDSFDGQGDQIRLSLSDLPPSIYYEFECELTVLALSSGALLGILFDTPQVRVIQFSPGGIVNALVPGVFSGQIGTYALGTTIDLRVEMNLALDTWTIYLNNLLAHSGSFGGATGVVATRISTPVTPNPAGATAGIDNIVIREVSTVAVEDTSWGRIKTLFR